MLLTHCQITILLEVNHQGVRLACLAQQPNAPNWIVVDCMVSTQSDCSTTSFINLLNSNVLGCLATSNKHTHTHNPAHYQHNYQTLYTVLCKFLFSFPPPLPPSSGTEFLSLAS